MSEHIANWRDRFTVHPAAELFPMMDDAELDELGADIKANGLRHPVVILGPTTADNKSVLLDGRNRLEAMRRADVVLKWSIRRVDEDGDNGIGDPNAYVISANLHRRHLSLEQRKQLAAKILAAAPEKSDRAVANVVKLSPKTVGVVRAKGEAREEIPHVEKRTDSKGRAQPAAKPKASSAVDPTERTITIGPVVARSTDDKVDNGELVAAWKHANADERQRFLDFAIKDRWQQVYETIRANNAEFVCNNPDECKPFDPEMKYGRKVNAIIGYFEGLTPSQRSDFSVWLIQQKFFPGQRIVNEIFGRDAVTFDELKQDILGYAKKHRTQLWEWLADHLEDVKQAPAAAPPVAPTEPTAIVEPATVEATLAPSAAPGRAQELYSVWSAFKPVTGMRLLAWVEAGRPSGYGPIINDVIINEKTSSFRDQLNAADGAVLERFLAMAKGSASNPVAGLELGTPQRKPVGAEKVEAL